MWEKEFKFIQTMVNEANLAAKELGRDFKFSKK